MKRKVLKIFSVVLAAALGCLAALALIGKTAYAAGLVDDKVDKANAYSAYPLENYQLDFYVDSSWDWLPWNWLDGIGQSIQYGLYAITNFIWTVSLYISNATGFVVQEGYNLDFISDTADAVGKNIQTLAGINAGGFSNDGFYTGFLLLLILVMGFYVAYVGLVKRETTKAVQAVMSFLAVFVISTSFIAYAPGYVGKINEFSSDVSGAALSLGTKIVMPDSEVEGRESVDLIRDSLFSVQVKQPWLLLQYGTSDVSEIGEDRIESLLSESPDTEKRQETVIEEIEDRENGQLSVTKTMSRLGMAVFLFAFNIGISIFIFLLTGMMIFSQVLFIIYAMFLPISLLLSMIPTFDGMAKKAVVKLFNTIMMRAGITLIITAAFSISTMFYAISDGYPFFMVAFLQIITFAGIYFKLGDIMSLFSLQAGDTQGMSRRFLRYPYSFARRRARRMERRIGKAVTGGVDSRRRDRRDRDPESTGRRNTAQKEQRRGMQEENRESAGRMERRSTGFHAGAAGRPGQEERGASSYQRGNVKRQSADAQKQEPQAGPQRERHGQQRAQENKRAKFQHGRHERPVARDTAPYDEIGRRNTRQTQEHMVRRNSSEKKPVRPSSEKTGLFDGETAGKMSNRAFVKDTPKRRINVRDVLDGKGGERG